MFQQAFHLPSEREPLYNHMLTPNLRFDIELAVQFAFGWRLHIAQVAEDINSAISPTSLACHRDYV
jgi:hypothetical protein